MTYENISSFSSTEDLNLKQKIDLIAHYRSQTKLTPAQQRRYFEIVQSLTPWAKKLLKKASLPKDEDNVQEVILQFLEIIDSGVESAYWIFEARIKEYFQKKNGKPIKAELKLMYEEQQAQQTQEESQMRLVNVSLTAEEKELMNNLFSVSRDQYCVRFGLSHEKYDEIVGNLKKKLGF